MINRPDYIAAIEPFIDKPLVKILAGIRRCGKSTIFEMLREELLRRGAREDQIICKRYTEMDIPENITAKQMYDELTAAMAGKGHCYLLLDEIQEITGWEKAVNSLLESADADIYVTGSNSKLMSSEISTYLTGRYVSIPVYTLSFREYLFFFRTNFGFPTKIAKQTAAIACPTTLLAIITYQKSFHFFKPVLLQIGRIYAIIKVQ